MEEEVEVEMMMGSCDCDGLYCCDVVVAAAAAEEEEEDCCIVIIREEVDLLA